MARVDESESHRLCSIAEPPEADLTLASLSAKKSFPCKVIIMPPVAGEFTTAKLVTLGVFNEKVFVRVPVAESTAGIAVTETPFLVSIQPPELLATFVISEEIDRQDDTSAPLWDILAQRLRGSKA